MHENLNIYVAREGWDVNYSVYIRTQYDQPDHRRGRALPVVFKKVEEEEIGTRMPPTMQLSPEDAQKFIDALWQAGLRPTEGTGSAGSLAATQRHLEDMRALVFKTQPK